MKKARIIYNPTSGRESFKRELPNVLERLETAGYETSAHATTREGDATEAAKMAVERKFDLVVAAGGDGTISEIINGMAEQAHRPKLGIIPTGTTNDFARALHIPKDMEKCVDVILNGSSKFLDIGKVNDHYFMNIAGGGKLTELTYEVPSKLKTMIGHLAYYVKGIEMLPSLKPTPAKIICDGEVIIDEDIMLFLIANTNSVGGFEKLAPDAKMDDGKFDVIILRKTNLADFIRLVTLALRGTHLEDDLIIYRQASHIEVTTDEKMQLNIDGEYGGLLPGEFKNLQQHIEFMLPEEF
jgi:diacylglycerol kinase (ATP)